MNPIIQNNSEPPPAKSSLTLSEPKTPPAPTSAVVDQKKPAPQRTHKSRINQIPTYMTREPLSFEHIKNEYTYFDKYRSIKVETGDPSAFKVMVTWNLKEIYLCGMKGLTCIMFDAYSGTGKAKFNQKPGSSL